jgi:hypothetical protein
VGDDGGTQVAAGVTDVDASIAVVDAGITTLQAGQRLVTFDPPRADPYLGVAFITTPLTLLAQ